MREHSFLRVSTCRTPLCTNKVLLPTIRCSHIQTRIYIDVTLTTRLGLGEQEEARQEAAPPRHGDIVRASSHVGL